MNKMIEIQLPIFGSVIQVYIAKKSLIKPLYKRVSKLAGQKKVKWSFEGLAIPHYVDSDKKRRFTILFDNNYYTAGLLAHESKHTVIHILKTVGIPISDDTEELGALMQEYIVNSVTDSLNPQKNWKEEVQYFHTTTW